MQRRWFEGREDGKMEIRITRPFAFISVGAGETTRLFLLIHLHRSSEILSRFYYVWNSGDIPACHFGLVTTNSDIKYNCYLTAAGEYVLPLRHNGYIQGRHYLGDLKSILFEGTRRKFWDLRSFCFYWTQGNWEQFRSKIIYFDNLLW